MSVLLCLTNGVDFSNTLVPKKRIIFDSDMSLQFWKRVP